LKKANVQERAQEKGKGKRRGKRKNMETMMASAAASNQRASVVDEKARIGEGLEEEVEGDMVGESLSVGVSGWGRRMWDILLNMSWKKQ
jgi:hypothetical protein